MNERYLGDFIRELRKKRVLSQYQLGKLVGVSDKAVSKWENGTARPGIGNCKKLAQALGVTADELLTCKFRTCESVEKLRREKLKSVWARADERLHEVYGARPHVSILGRYETEKRLLQKSDTILHFDFLSKVAQLTRVQRSIAFTFGHVNSFFAAWLLGSTEVNPLEPHYYCPRCKTVEFHPEVLDGYDLPEKDCHCGCRLQRDGHGVSVGYGIEGVRISGDALSFTVTLPFAAISQATALLKEQFRGVARVIRVITKQEKRMKNGWASMPRYILVPEREAVDFRNDWVWVSSEEFQQRFGKYPRFCFVGEVYSTMLQYLCLRTNRTPERIDFLDERVLQAYRECTYLDALDDDEWRPIRPWIHRFAPECFSQIARVHGLRHGTNVWEGNGEILVAEGVAKQNEVIAFAEDIYRSVMSHLAPSDLLGEGLALKVMKSVQVGRYSVRGMPEEIESALTQLGLPAWYIDSMKKIEYLFPKGHVIAYLQRDMRLVWFSIAYPELFAAAKSAAEKGVEENEARTVAEEKELLSKGIPQLKKAK